MDGVGGYAQVTGGQLKFGIFKEFWFVLFLLF
jgi:hypothetical protein